MSWELKKRLKLIVNKEIGTVKKEFGGKTSVALVYPNTYSVGMGNLAVHAFYKMLNDQDDFVCERVFLPDKNDLSEYKRTSSPLMSLESQRPLSDFDIVAFSISFENDYLNIIPILELAKIPHRKNLRGESYPLLICGGAAPTLNPEPLREIFDSIFIGEMECFTPEDICRGTARRAPTVHAKDLDDYPVQTAIYSDRVEFGNMHLIEVQRGCPYRCNFCATPAIYGKPRMRSADAVMKMVETGLKYRKKFGLIGAYILSHPEFELIAERIHALGATFSPSSVRVNDISEKKAKLLVQSGHRSLSLGIESGSEKLRDRLNKGVSDEQILDAVGILAKNGITRIRLYFMIGLPNETDDDIQKIVELSSLVQNVIETSAEKKSRTTSTDITISPFVPKPCTVFENEPFAGEVGLKRKVKMLKRLVLKNRALKINFDPIINAVIESYLCNCRESALSFLEKNI